MASVLVACEIRDGKLRKATREALTAGRRLAVESGGRLEAMAFGSSASAAASEAGAYGVKKLWVVGDSSLDPYQTETWTAAAKGVIDQASPGILLLGGTAAGRDLAPRLAARIGVGVASDVDRLEWVDGNLRARRPVYSGKAFATVVVESRPAIATCRPSGFPAEEGDGGAPEIAEVSVTLPAPRARVVEVKSTAGGELTIAEADIIVSGGRGLKEPANFSLIRDLAHALGAAVGASRATVDAGWIDHQHQVGQTGRVVSPNLYIAVGISGAIQHLAGMSSSKHIVAINKDPEAPIFRVADLGVVGDLFAILPPLTEEVKKVKGSH
ncbi:MAG TPA: electron transfer flavoprotein subunit alpha/FixB family protein [Thermoanaerobaculia bacterium]|nr:electron transfer flavoprotein subunit alpha/FixB family protein [Thermoanaerobaculia bacterium]